MPLITRIAAILFGILVALVLLTLLAFHLYEKQYPHRTSEAAPVVTFASLPPAPRLQATPRKDWQQVHAEEEAHLEVYGWVDGAHGMARIPIERAMVRWVELQNAPGRRGRDERARRRDAAQSGCHRPGGNAPPRPTGEEHAGTPRRRPRPPAGVTELQMRQDKAKEAAHAP